MRDAVEGWLVLRGEDVPEPWRERAVRASLIPLLPGEASRLLEKKRSLPEVPPDEEPLLRAVAEGLPAAAIAQRLNVSVRTVERKLSFLRRSLGVRSTKELALLLARRGF